MSAEHRKRARAWAQEVVANEDTELSGLVEVARSVLACLDGPMLVGAIQGMVAPQPTQFDHTLMPTRWSPLKLEVVVYVNSMEEASRATSAARELTFPTDRGKLRIPPLVEIRSVKARQG